MFNYNELNVTLKVSPQISPIDFYTKDESKRLFIQDVPEFADGSVYGRTNGMWVKIDGSYDKLFAGFSDASTKENLVEDGNFEKLSIYAYVLFDGSVKGVKVSEKNDRDGKVLWFCTKDTITTIDTESGLPITVPQAETIEYDGETYNAYKMSGLSKGDFTFSISINGQSVR